ncbi:MULTISPECIES: type II toxin-antitoxin system HicA family toxin [unclassified Nostoc]|nr:MULTISPECIES: type II toxin-antitoxin system HicA family toxin [unclassified Nostoc]
MILSIPVHSNGDLPIRTLKGIMKDAGLTEEDLGEIGWLFVAI